MWKSGSMLIPSVVVCDAEPPACSLVSVGEAAASGQRAVAPVSQNIGASEQVRSPSGGASAQACAYPPAATYSAAPVAASAACAAASRASGTRYGEHDT